MADDTTHLWLSKSQLEKLQAGDSITTVIGDDTVAIARRDQTTIRREMETVAPAHREEAEYTIYLSSTELGLVQARETATKRFDDHAVVFDRKRG